MNKILLHIICSLLLVIICKSATAQEFSNQRTQKITITKDTIYLDTLSIVPGTVFIKTVNQELIDTVDYFIDAINARLILKNKKWNNKEIIIAYQVFPVLFSKKYFHKNPKLIEPDLSGTINPFKYTPGSQKEDFFNFGKLNKNGSISRGFSVGNNQDMIMNSSLNLQLSGMLSDDIEILAAITDNNIPVQPEGNTQQLQEFDKVFIQLSNRNYKLIAGDFEMKKPTGYFLNLNKKAQGLSLANQTLIGGKKLSQKDKSVLTTTVSGALSKGKYHRITYNGRDGVQGPYRLTGANNEMYITILAGTEKIYIDGQLLKRGKEYDYTIDYNMAEVTFTPLRMISRNSRIVVEFEYTDKSYVRSMFLTSSEFQAKKITFRVNAYMEQDSKNQQLQQTLNDSMKHFLNNIGDNVNNAWYPNVSNVPFSDNEVLYKLTDSLVNGIYYDSVFVYSINPDSAFFRLGFSQVGNNKGNYIQINTTANGKVYRWVAPVNGMPQGNFEPVTLLVSPKLKHLYTFGTEYRFGKAGKTSIETGISNNDLNMFSTKDDKDNIGTAIKYQFVNDFILRHDSLNPLFLTAQIDYEFINKDFQQVERYRNAEFERNWNSSSISAKTEQHIPMIGITIGNKKNRSVSAQTSSYITSSDYRGYMNYGNLKYDYKNYFLMADGSLMQSISPEVNSNFLKHKISLAKRIKSFSIGIREESESNQLFRKLKPDSLVNGSFNFSEAEIYAGKEDSIGNSFMANSKRRWDYFVKNGKYNYATLTDDIGISAGLRKNQHQQLSFRIIYRMQKNFDTTLSDKKQEQNVVGQIEYNLRINKNLLTSSTYYEIGSGLEAKKEYSYIEVVDGRGIYKWTDYNKNGVKEIDEFEVSNFQDEAKYIRIFTPTNEYIKIYNVAFNEVLNIDPYVALSRYKGVRKLLSRFSDRFVYRMDRKSGLSDMWLAYHPLPLEVNDSNLVTLGFSYRNTVFFNKNNNKFGVEWTYQENRQKNLAANGFDFRTQMQNGIKIRYWFLKYFTASLNASNGFRRNGSDYLNNRNYNILIKETEPMITIQPSMVFRTNIFYRYTEKQNTEGQKENCINRKTGTEITYKIPSKGSLIARFVFVENTFSGEKNSAIGYEMLEGLNDGRNLTWSLSFQRDLSKYLQLSLNYEGRKPNEEKIIHTGSIQLRAYF